MLLGFPLYLTGSAWAQSPNVTVFASGLNNTHPVQKPNAADFEPDGTWYSMIAVYGALFAVEPNHGELDMITPEGYIRRIVDISATQGHIVPTAVAYHHGNFYDGKLGTFPIADGSSKILKITPFGQVTTFATGFTTVLGLAFDTEAINHNDAAAIAALYTEDKIFCERHGCQSTVGKPFRTMRLRVLLVLTALAFGFAVRALAFEGDLAGDVKALDEFAALGMKYDEAYKRGDAVNLAALFTEDAVLVTPEGLFSGRQAVEKWFTDLFDRWHPTNNIGQADQLNAIDNGAWAVGKWWCTFQSQNGPVFARGYWSMIYVRDADGWKIRMSLFNQTSPPVAPAETK